MKILNYMHIIIVFLGALIPVLLTAYQRGSVCLCVCYTEATKTETLNMGVRCKKPRQCLVCNCLQLSWGKYEDENFARKVTLSRIRTIGQKVPKPK